MSDEKKKEFMDQKCGHCGNVAPMEVVGQYSNVCSHSNYPDKDYIEWDEGYYYRIMLCPACEEVMFLKFYYHEYLEDEKQQIEILYPNKLKKIMGLPSEVNRAYEAANRVKKIDPNAYAVLLGRVLDKICDDRKAEGKSLFDRLANLANRNEIPKPLLEIAYSLKDFRNIGAHADLGELPKNVILVLDDLCRAILEYVYHGPQLIKEAKEKIDKLKKKKKGKKDG